MDRKKSAITSIVIQRFPQVDGRCQNMHRYAYRLKPANVKLVIGPPGAGKTTFCNGMHQFLGALGRKSSVVNLDAANDRVSYPCALDVFSLITLEDIMKHEGLGPNGGIIYALETLEANFEWLQEGLAKLGGTGTGTNFC